MALVVGGVMLLGCVVLVAPTVVLRRNKPVRVGNELLTASGRTEQVKVSYMLGSVFRVVGDLHSAH